MRRSRLDSWAQTFLAVALLVTVAAGWWSARRTAAQSPAAAPPSAPAARNVSEAQRELERYEQRYGPNHYSQGVEEWLIRDYLQDRRAGFFVDVGANHYKNASKTYYLESSLRWSGLAVEPQQELGADYVKFRPRTKFLPFFVSDVSHETAKFYILSHGSQIASSDPDFVKAWGKPGEVRAVPTITLNDLLDTEKVTRIDFLSMDIELHEPQALKGFDIDRFKPGFVCIEALLPVRQQILDYFARHGYVLVGKYLWLDEEDLYFADLNGSH
jgi:FkbM family methyltransferase